MSRDLCSCVGCKAELLQVLAVESERILLIEPMRSEHFLCHPVDISSTTCGLGDFVILRLLGRVLSNVDRLLPLLVPELFLMRSNGSSRVGRDR